MSKKITGDKAKQILKKIVLFVVLIALWQLAFYLTTDVFALCKPYIFPNPFGVIESFMSLAEGGALLLAVLTSLRRVVVGYLMSIVLGLLLGILIYRVKLANEVLRPIFLGLQTLPSICWMPFAILWFGLSEAAILFVIVIGSSFSVALAIEGSLRQVDPTLIRAGQTMGASKIRLFTSVILPAGLPGIVTGLKQGWSFAWRALMNGEMLSAAIGLGQLLMYGRELSDINQVMCIMLIIVFLGVIVDRFVFGSLDRYMAKKRGLGHLG